VTSEFSEQQASGEDLKKSLGNLLARARNEREISLVQAVTDLKLNREYLQALESGDWTSLPGRFYARGFLRQYARYLNVDIRAELEALKTGDYQLTRPHTFPDPPIAPKKFWAITSGITFLLLLVLFNIFSSRNNGRADTATEVQPVTDHPPFRKQQGVATAGMETPATEMAEPVDQDRKSRSKESADIFHLYRFRAHKLPVWLRLFDSRKKRIRTLFLKPGKATQLRLKGPIYISTGRAGALSIHMDGNVVVPTGSLGKQGSAVRMFRVSDHPQPS